ncbi:MAG TPA: hypothetical protein VFU02_09755 [Polyangiaceae bacterium]|nr:hypothetical protein [Polyangiaceae bacterium]
MDIRQFTLITAFIASLAAPQFVCAQEALERPTASQQPAKSHETIETLQGSAAAYRSQGSMSQAFSGGTPATDEGCTHCRGWLVEALLRWTDRLVTRLDPIGLVETPFQPTRRDSVRPATSSPPEWRPIPRFRPVQLHGGYGLVARITF